MNVADRVVVLSRLVHTEPLILFINIEYTMAESLEEKIARVMAGIKQSKPSENRVNQINSDSSINFSRPGTPKGGRITIPVEAKSDFDQEDDEIKEDSEEEYADPKFAKPTDMNFSGNIIAVEL